jgi:transposase
LEAEAEREGRTVVWVDESALYLLPGVVRTYAPKGETPILKLPLSRDHLSAISGVTKAGRLLLRLQDRAYASADVVPFLRQLLRCLRGTLLVIWDGAAIHRAQPIKDFLATPSGRRLRLETLPGYAPELNPDEGIWNYLKHVELKNVRCDGLDHLHDELVRAAKRLRHKQDVIQGCFRQVGYAV